jgi:hypothetical protein
MGHASMHRWEDKFKMDVKEICREVWLGLVWLMIGMREWFL